MNRVYDILCVTPSQNSIHPENRFTTQEAAFKHVAPMRSALFSIRIVIRADMDSDKLGEPIRFVGIHAQEWAALMVTIHRLGAVLSTPKGWTHAE